MQVEEAGPLARGGSRPRAVPGQDAKGHHQLTGGFRLAVAAASSTVSTTTLTPPSTIAAIMY